MYLIEPNAFAADNLGCQQVALLLGYQLKASP
jgi:hypothetical protein